MAKHFSKRSSTHMLIDYVASARISELEVEEWMKKIEGNVREVRETEEEVRKLQQRQVEVNTEIDTLLETYIHNLREAAAAAKSQLSTQVASAISRIQSNLSQSPHPETITLTLTPPNIDSIFQVSVYREEKYVLASAPGGGWRFKGGIDALSFKPSVGIYLTAVALTKGGPESIVTPRLMVLEVLEGRESQGTVIYRHTHSELLTSSHQYMTVVRLEKEVQLQAEGEYTVKAVVEGGEGYRIGPLCAGQQDGLEVSLFPCRFKPGDTNNGSTGTSGIFFELWYRK